MVDILSIIRGIPSIHTIFFILAQSYFRLSVIILFIKLRARTVTKPLTPTAISQECIYSYILVFNNQINSNILFAKCVSVSEYFTV